MSLSPTFQKVLDFGHALLDNKIIVKIKFLSIELKNKEQK